MENLLQVGAILDTHGLRGEVKVFPLTDDVMRFKNMKDLILDTGREQITLEELGEKSGRFNYEFACDLGKRIPEDVAVMGFDNVAMASMVEPKMIRMGVEGMQ